MEFMASLRGSFDDQKPSIFELLSEQELNNLLPPTLRYLLAVATQRNPRYLLRVLNSFDELYALGMLVVESHYLTTRGGGFTENFYGLKRERALLAEIPRASASAPHQVRETLKLTRGDVVRNLLVMVGVPYLKRKLDDAHEVDAPRALLGSAYTRMPANATVRQKILHYYRWFLRNVYPSVHAGYGFAVMAFHLAYLFDNSKYHHPLLWLIGTRMRRMTAADFQAIDQLGEKVSQNAGKEVTFFSMKNLGPKLLSGLSLALPMSIFALKFLEWWHASDFARQLSRKAAESLGLPPPIVTGVTALSLAKSDVDLPNRVEAEKSEKDGEEVAASFVTAENAPIAASSLLPILTVPPPADSEFCPICADEITTATACQTGIVYCYSCIHRWIEGIHPKQEAFMKDKAERWESGKGRCAVTGRRVLGGTEGLRRIMI